MTDLIKQINNYSQKAKKAAAEMLGKKAGDRKQALLLIAKNIAENAKQIIQENKIDLANGIKNNLSEALLDRLELNQERIDAMVAGTKQIAKQEDPIGSISDLKTQARGFKVGKMRTPIGVIGMIYESRPNVTLDAAAICIKSGNSVILRGGSEAFYSNMEIAKIIRQALEKSNISKDTVQLINTTDREAVNLLIGTPDLIDVIIPRGGKSLVKLISEKAKVPVIKHLEGICHVYIDKFADNEKSIKVAFNSKTYRYGICGAMETLLVHKDKVTEVMSVLINMFNKKGILLVGCEEVRYKFPEIKKATLEDWQTEYLSAKLSIKVVDNIEQAIKHINQYGSHHTDSIITENIESQNKFLNLVDSSSVMLNTSTCFADGFEYGLGAEIGISTDKLHVRGPVGVVGLTTEKYIVLGDGEIRD